MLPHQQRISRQFCAFSCCLLVAFLLLYEWLESSGPSPPLHLPTSPARWCTAQPCFTCTNVSLVLEKIRDAPPVGRGFYKQAVAVNFEQRSLVVKLPHNTSVSYLSDRSVPTRQNNTRLTSNIVYFFFFFCKTKKKRSFGRLRYASKNEGVVLSTARAKKMLSDKFEAEKEHMVRWNSLSDVPMVPHVHGGCYQPGTMQCCVCCLVLRVCTRWAAS